MKEHEADWRAASRRSVYEEKNSELSLFLLASSAFSRPVLT